MSPVRGRRLAILRLTEASARKNIHAATSAAPTSEIHMMVSASVGFALLVRLSTNHWRCSWLAASMAKTSGR